MGPTQTALSYVIFSCIVSVTILGTMSFYKQSNSPDLITKIIESLGGVMLASITAKAGLSIPTSEKESGPNKPDITPDKK